MVFSSNGIWSHFFFSWLFYLYPNPQIPTFPGGLISASCNTHEPHGSCVFDLELVSSLPGVTFNPEQSHTCRGPQRPGKCWKWVNCASLRNLSHCSWNVGSPCAVFYLHGLDRGTCRKIYGLGRGTCRERWGKQLHKNENTWQPTLDMRTEYPKGRGGVCQMGVHLPVVKEAAATQPSDSCLVRR